MTLEGVPESAQGWGEHLGIAWDRSLWSAVPVWTAGDSERVRVRTNYEISQRIMNIQQQSSTVSPHMSLVYLQGCHGHSRTTVSVT